MEASTPPTVLTLPHTCTEYKDLLCPTDEDFESKLTNTQTWPLYTLRGNNLGTQEVAKIMPLPSFIIYDGFDKDLWAAEIYERVCHMDNQADPLWVAARNFLKSCMVKRRATDKRSFVNAPIFITTPPPARQSKHNIFVGKN